MPRGQRRVIHGRPGEEGDGLDCGIGGGYYSTDATKVTCPECKAVVRKTPESGEQ